MKKTIRVVLIILAFFAAGILINNILLITGLGVAVSRNAPRMTKDELISCLNQNKEVFSNATTIFVKYPDILDITGYNKYGKGNGSDNDKYYTITKKKIYIRSKKPIDNEVKNEIDDSDIKLIFNKLKFESISKTDDCIYFIEGSNLGYAQGIVYSPLKEQPEYKYLIALENIEDKWFFFKLR